MSKPAQRGRPPRRQAPPQQPTMLSIGNVRVELPRSLKFSRDDDGICINISNTGTINMKVATETPKSLTGFVFTLLNAKTVDAAGKLVLEEVLTLYHQELPAMNYAANTGKESRFLENCVLGGKYCTLVLRNAESELIGAMTYQILPTDTHQAELPLAAVAQAHHRKGFGSYICKELQKRLLDVGALSIFCWGDQESEAFWAKQGFVTVAEVDGRGKPWKLPIKADVRRAMSIPGSATLMISYLSAPSVQPAFPGPPACNTLMSHQETSGEIRETTAMETSPPRHNCSPEKGGKSGPKLSPSVSITTPQVVGESKTNCAHTVTPVHATTVESGSTGKNFCQSITPLNMEGMLSSVASEGSRGTVSELPLSPGALAKSTRPPLANVTNTVPAPTGATRPPKKRPFIGVGQADWADKLSLDGREETVAREEDKENEVRFANELVKLSMSGRKGKAGLKVVGKVQSPTAEVNEEARVKEALDKENEFNETPKSGMHFESESAVESEAKIGAKRGREAQAQTKVFGRRSARRRKADPVPNTVPEAHGMDEQTNGETEEGTQDDHGVQLMVNLLLPQPVKDTGGDITAEVETFVADCLEPDTRTANRTTICTSPVHQPITHMDGEMPICSQIEAGPAARSAEAQEIRSNGIKSRSSSLTASEIQCPMKLPVEMSTSGEAGQLKRKTRPVIFLMNMGDENQKKQLTKYVEKLAGEVTSDGFQCTHLVTGEARRTLNFCVAISSGAWIVTADWLKVSVKQKSFADEARFVLRDRRFEAKYKVLLPHVVSRAQQRPNLLLDGMHIFPTPHVHPPLDTLSQMVKAAGGKVLGSLKEVLQVEDKSHALVVACDEDMLDAVSAAKAGILTFSSDWLLTCIMKQELDLTATQFSESL